MPKSLLVDTDVFSYIIDNRPEAQRFHSRFSEGRVFLSFITCGEMLAGAFKKNWGRSRMQNLRHWIDTTTVIPYTDDLPFFYAMIISNAYKNGYPIKPNDAWIAATAMAHGIPLLTNNIKDFKNVPGLQLL